MRIREVCDTRASAVLEISTGADSLRKGKAPAGPRKRPSGGGSPGALPPLVRVAGDGTQRHGEGQAANGTPEDANPGGLAFSGALAAGKRNGAAAGADAHEGSPPPFEQGMDATPTKRPRERPEQGPGTSATSRTERGRKARGGPEGAEGGAAGAGRGIGHAEHNGALPRTPQRTEATRRLPRGEPQRRGRAGRTPASPQARRTPPPQPSPFGARRV